METEKVSEEKSSLTAVEEVPAKSYRDPTLSRTAPSTIAAVLAMDQLGVPRTEIARREKISTSTLYEILKRGDHMNPAIVESVKKNMAAHYWVTGERSLQHITDDKLEKASANALMWIAGVSTDKALLLEGKPTSRVEHMSAEDTQAADKIRALEDELGGWKDGTTINVVGDLVGTDDASPTT